MIAVYRVMEMETTDGHGLLVWDTREIRGQGKKLMKRRCLRDIKKHGFPYRCGNTWNDLEKEKVEAKNVHEFCHF